MNNKTPAQPRHCAYCGSPLSQTARFCEACGQPAIPESASAAVRNPPPPVFLTPPPISIPPVAPPTKRSLAIPGLLILGIGAVCCLGIGAVAAAFLLFKTVLTPVQTEGEPPPAVVMKTIVEIATEAPQATSLPEVPTALPPTSTPEDVAPSTNVEFEGIRFYLDPRIASGITGEMVPSSTGPDVPDFGLEPEHIQINFNGYTLTDTFHEAEIMIYPVDEYARLNPDVGKIVGELRQVMTMQPDPASIDHLPFLPIWPAAQYMQAQIRYLSFHNGTGMRYLTQFGQDLYPVNNESMFYTYQGLTQDGQYYLAAVFPASHPALPPADSIELNQAFSDNFEKYILDTESLLNTQEPDSYTPDLSLLDELIHSLEIDR